MSWLDSDWTRRAAISIDNHAGASQEDITLAIQSDFPEFWDNVQPAAGADIRVTAADGTTLLTYQLVGFNSTTKVCTVQVDNMPLPTAATCVAWLYWGYTNASSAAGSFTISGSEKTGTLEVSVPGSGTEVVIPCRPEAPGATVPRAEIGKQTAEELHVWWDLSRVLVQRGKRHENSRLLEEIESVEFNVSTGGVTQTAMMDNDEDRLVHPHFIRTTVKAGTTATNYLLKMTVITTGGRTIQCLASLRVKNAAEPS